VIREKQRIREKRNGKRRQRHTGQRHARIEKKYIKIYLNSTNITQKNTKKLRFEPRKNRPRFSVRKHVQTKNHQKFQNIHEIRQT